MQQEIYKNQFREETEEVINFNIKKVCKILISRAFLMIVSFFLVLLILTCSTFITSKKYSVGADIYINDKNSTNISEVNPYVLNQAGGSLVSMGVDKAMNNEIEIMKSPLVMDKVIKENNIKYESKYSFFKNPKEGEFVSTQDFIGKGKYIKFDIKKNTNIITIKYISKDPKLAYNVVNSIINNYIELHKEINSYKSTFDKQILEAEYNRAKEELKRKVNASSGLPSNAIAGSGNFAALSAFSTSAQKAMGMLKGQIVQGEKSRVEIAEESAKVESLSKKLEWAKLVEDMSETSKVLILSYPKKLRDFEYFKPNLKKNIFLGIILGFLFALLTAVLIEKFSSKLCYSSLDDDIIYNIKKEFLDLNTYLLMNDEKPVLFVMFDDLPQNIAEKVREFKNVKFIKADLTPEFINEINQTAETVFVAKINSTNRQLYEKVKSVIKTLNKKIAKEILV